MKKNKITAIFLSLLLTINMIIGFWPGQIKGTEINTTQSAVEEQQQPVVEELPIVEEQQPVTQEETTVSEPVETTQKTILPQEYQDVDDIVTSGDSSDEIKETSLAGTKEVLINVQNLINKKAKSLQESIYLAKYAEGEISLEQTYTKDEFNQVKDFIGQNSVNGEIYLIIGSDGKIMYTNQGIAVTLGGYSKGIQMSLSLDEADQGTSENYISGGAFDAQFFNTYEKNGNYYAEILVGGLKGFVNINEIQILPQGMALGQSYYFVENGVVYHNVAVDPITSESYEKIELGNAEELVENNNYYSYDGINFYAEATMQVAPLVSSDVSNYFQNLPIRSVSNYTGAQYKDYLTSLGKTNSKYYNDTSAFVDAQKLYGINALYLFAMANHEGAFGTSTYSNSFNNFYGRGAVDSNPDNAANYSFSTPRDGILGQAAWLSISYTDVQDYRYFGTHPGDKRDGLNAFYATDPLWGEKVASHMKQIDTFLGNQEINKYRIGKVVSTSVVAKDKNLATPILISQSKNNYTLQQRQRPDQLPGEPRVIITEENATSYQIQLPTPINNTGSTTLKYNEATGGAYPLFKGESTQAGIPVGIASFAAPYTDWPLNRGYISVGAVSIIENNPIVAPDVVKTEIKLGNIAITQQDSKSFTVVLKNLIAPNGVKSISVPVWTTNKGQDDIISYDATLQLDGSYKAVVEIKNHNYETGEYNVDVYGVDNLNSSNQIYTGKTVVSDLSNTVVTAASTGGTTFDVTVDGLSYPNGIKTIQVPIWSLNNGQDDLFWYTGVKQSDGTFKVSVNTANHKNDRGAYALHVYGVDINGTNSMLTTGIYEVPNMKAGTVNIIQNDSKSFSVVIKDISAPTGLKSISVPVWSNNKGQDDLIWYTATRQTDGSYKADINIKDHNYETGDYNVHVYGVDNTNYSTWIYSSRFKILDLSNTTVVGKATGGTTFDVIVDGLSYPNGIKTIQVPIWSLNNGQDDLVWYTGIKQSDGTFRVSVNTANHKNDRGTYALHVYGVDINGTNTPLTTGVYEVPEMKAGTVNIIQNDSKSFSVVIKDISAPTGLKSISVPVWSNNKGQDDLIWYTATRQTDGSYKADVNIKDHNYETGDYNVHVYGVDNTNYSTWIYSSRFKILDLSNTTVVGKATGGTTFDVIVDGLSYPNGIKTIQVPIWSLNNGQDDLVWYTGIKQSDGTFRISVNIANHKNDRGSYALHVYGVDINGINAPLTTGVYEVPGIIFGTVGITQNDSKSFSVTIKDVFMPAGLKSISVAVWSNNKGQDDLLWHTATRQADGSYKADINIKDHNYETGNYIVHIYGMDNSNANNFLTASTINIQDLSTSTTKIVDNNDDTFTVTLDGLSYENGLKSLNLAVWTRNNNQDDLVWHPTTKQADGTYQAIISIKDHNHESGQYIVHAYGMDINNNSFVVGTTEITMLDISQTEIHTSPSSKSTFDVIIEGLSYPNGIKSIQVPVWSDNNGQDDIVWYTAYKQPNGSYKAGVNIINHKNDMGNYTIHVYGTDIYGKSSMLGITSRIVTTKQYKGIDVSEHQGNINWSAVKTSGVEFAMIRSGYGQEVSQVDKKFYQNVAGARSVGIQVGAYHYSYAQTVAGAVKEAEVCSQIIAGQGIKWVAFDIEDPNWQGNTPTPQNNWKPLTNQDRTNITNAFVQTMESKGYRVMVYSSLSWINNMMYYNQINRPIWLAHWTTGAPGRDDSLMWQYTSDGIVNGINGGVDMNVLYSPIW